MAFFRSLIERREFSLARWEAWLDGLSTYSTDTGIEVSDSSALSWSVAWGSVLILAQDVAKLPLSTYERIQIDGKPGRREARWHSLWKVFRVAANPFMSAYTFRQTMQKHLGVRGNAYAIIERDVLTDEVIGLWPRSPSRMEPKIEGGQVIYYYTDNSGSKTPYPADQVFHLRHISDDGIIGKSPVEVFREGIGLGLAYQKHAGRTFKNGARIPFFLKHPMDLGPAKAKEMLDAFNAQYAGLDNPGKTALLYGGLDVAQVGFSNKDSEFIESRKLTNEDGYRIWRIPPTKLMDFAKSAYANVTETNIAYVNDTLRPHQENWEQEIHLKLLGEEERDRIYVEHDNYDLLKGTPKERAEIEVAYVNSGVSQIDEVRASHNWNPVPGGDKNRTQMQNVPLDQADQQAQQQQGGPAQQQQQPRRNGDGR